MIKIPLPLFKEILYFLNNWLRLMGYGTEHRRLSRLIWKLYQARVIGGDSITEFRSIVGVIKDFERIERIEAEK